jgi:mannose-6-phosphate isomerase
VDLLENTVQPYAWGSTRAIAELLGKPSPSPKPEAELWMGAHPSSPSRIWRDGAWRSLTEVIEANPVEEIGSAAFQRFGSHLPFLFKVLAAETPLSLQAHPNGEQATAGFDAEERARIARDASNRNYKDAKHKPELVCALTEFDALCGFREVDETASLFRLLGVRPVEERLFALRKASPSETLERLFSWLMSLTGAERAAIVDATVSAAARVAGEKGQYATECGWAMRIAQLYPGDVGVVVALLLNFVRLAPGEALFLPAGQLHAYLGGFALEIMANSDNVLRAGLTPKHVDVPELMRVLEFTGGPVTPRLPVRGDGELAYVAPVPEFRLSRIDLGSGPPFHPRHRGGPEILLCTEGRAVAHGPGGAALELTRGASIFVPARDATYELSGRGTVFRATVGAL